MTRSIQRVVVLVAVMAVAASARAQYGGSTPPPATSQDNEAGVGAPGGYAVEQTLRPMTLKELTLRVDLAVPVTHLQLTGVGTTSTTTVALTLGAGYGVTDDFEIGATVVPLELSPDVNYLNPTVYALGRLYHDDTLQVGLSGSITLPLRSMSPFAFTVALPLWVTPSPFFQLRTGLSYFGDVPTGAGNYVHELAIPLAFLFQPVDLFFLGLETGVSMILPSAGTYDAGSSIFVPAAFSLGVSVPGPGPRRTPAADIYASFGFPLFLVPGSHGDVVQTSFWTLTVGVRGFFTL